MSRAQRHSVRKAKRRFDEAITLDEVVKINNDRLRCITGVELEKSAGRLAEEGKQFDLVVSRAVIEEIYDPGAVFLVADRLLRPSGISFTRLT